LVHGEAQQPGHSGSGHDGPVDRGRTYGTGSAAGRAASGCDGHGRAHQLLRHGSPTPAGTSTTPPVIAFDKSAAQISACRGKVDHDLVHDRVVKICPAGNGGGTVTIKLTTIFSFGRPAQYMSTEASDPMVATLDRGTFTPAMNDLPVGGDDSAFSAVERLFVMINGPTGRRNPQRQGLNSALVDKLDPLHVIGGIPTLALDYSPMWDINLGRWSPNAVRRGYRSRLIDEFQLLEFVRRGHITGPAGAPYGSVGIRVNCPIVHRFLSQRRAFAATRTDSQAA
jgi:hypothetical protein